MRIRKNRTSSRVTPEFCLAHGIIPFEKKQNFSQSKAATESISLLEDHCSELEKPEFDASEIHEDFNRIDGSLDDDKRASVKLKEGNARLGECKNHGLSLESPHSNGSESDAGRRRAIDSNHPETTIAKQRSRVKPPRSSLTDKVKSNASSKPTEIRSQRSELPKEEVLEESGISHGPLPKLTIMSVASTAVDGSTSGTGSRKRRRSKIIEPDSNGKNGNAKSRFEGEGCGHDYKPAAPAAGMGMEVSSRKKERKLAVEVEETEADRSPGKSPEAGMGMEVSSRKKERKVAVEEEETEADRSPGKSPEAPSFPAGWSYRGLAQIAEQDKPPQGKQCSRTDGRSWRCPLKVQEGFTLCEHHLSKFRLKKVSKENRKQKLLHWRRQRWQEEQQVLPLERDEEEHQDEQETPTSSAPDESRIAESVQSSGSSERNVPKRLRRRHKTVKLSVL
ncbi:hypothetical protein R1sor_011613 [Riccia sorocarpa]|uniref:WRC domain-containing protein n=1 Tax=Riccia sorocarpa TaxID=122646 RepID=A0ABD3I434_9MARC